MFIIVVAHIPENSWNDWIPARFGFSSAAEMFVFCSGFACALAYGRTFDRSGFVRGCARVARRIWTLYWAQLAPFLIVFAASAYAAANLGAPQSLARLDLAWFMANPGEGVGALLTMRYIPHYFDMLPLYVVLLALLPLMEALRRIEPRVPLVCALLLWAAVQLNGFNLPAKPGTDAGWFFNPFAWQALFFIGYGFGRGDIAPPRWGLPALMRAACAFLVLSALVSFWGVTQHLPLLGALSALLGYDGSPTALHPLRLLHVLALAYVVLSWIEPRRAALNRNPVACFVASVGRKTLPVFLVSIPAALSLGIVLDIVGRDALTIAVANFAGLAAVVATSRCVAWFDSDPTQNLPPQNLPPQDKPCPDLPPQDVPPIRASLVPTNSA